MTLYRYGYVVVVGDPLDQDQAEAIEALNEAAASSFAATVRLALGAGAHVEVAQLTDPQHPADPDCECTGDDGWHCDGEWSQHWQKVSGDPLSECGHCGWAPEPPGTTA